MFFLTEGFECCIFSAKLYKALTLTEAQEQSVHTHSVDAEEAVGDEVGAKHHRLEQTHTAVKQPGNNSHSSINTADSVTFSILIYHSNTAGTKDYYGLLCYINNANANNPKELIQIQQ